MTIASGDGHQGYHKLTTRNIATLPQRVQTVDSRFFTTNTRELAHLQFETTAIGGPALDGGATTSSLDPLVIALHKPCQRLFGQTQPLRTGLEILTLDSPGD